MDKPTNKPEEKKPAAPAAPAAPGKPKAAAPKDGGGPYGATTAGAASLNSKTQNTASLTCEAASGGTAPYTYQWYRSLSSGFTPGPATEIAGATSLNLEDTGLIPGTQYYYVCVATDDSATPVEDASNEVSVVTSAPTQNPNQFNQDPHVGQLDMRFNYNTVPVMIDASQADDLYAGGAVKLMNSVGGVPKVVGCSADSDGAIGFLNYDPKTVAYEAGMPAEISMKGNVMYLYATAAIARGAQVVLDLTTNGGVKQTTGATGSRIVGWAMDRATAAGQLIRVFIETPSFTLDS